MAVVLCHDQEEEEVEKIVTVEGTQDMLGTQFCIEQETVPVKVLVEFRTPPDQPHVDEALRYVDYR